mgnify:CR=1 FL=1
MKLLITTVPFAGNDKRPLELLAASGVDYLINPLNRKLREQELADHIVDCDVIIAGTEPITDYVLERATNLKLIVRVGIGLDSLDLLGARRRGIQVSYTPDSPSPAVAEMTIGLMITLLRSMYISNSRIRQGEWLRYFGRRLSEIVIGIIGVGRIGGRVVRLLTAFDCSHIIVNDIDPRIELPKYPGCMIEKVNKETIYREADIVSLHVPLTARTRNLITKKELCMMKRDALIINTARGGIVNEQDFLKLGHLSLRLLPYTCASARAPTRYVTSVSQPRVNKA